MMTRKSVFRAVLAIATGAVLVAGIFVIVRTSNAVARRHVVAYFADSNGIYVGDDVRILGVRVGKIDRIEPEPSRVRISFWYNDKYKVPADAKAVILSPSLVTARSIQLTPAYTGGPQLPDATVIPQDRTAVPVEWDDIRTQLDRLAQTLQPTEPGGVSTLGALVNTAADNLRGQGPDIRRSIIELSQTFSALGDHSSDIFGTLKNLSILVSALRDSTGLLQQLNGNLASVTGLLANGQEGVGQAVHDIDDVLSDVQGFVADNRESLGTTSDKLASVTQALHDSLDDIKQTLHIAPNAIQNFMNIYQPAQGTLSGNLAANDFANPLSFICGAIQAASRLNADQSSKLCVQYLAPILKNRQINFPPLGEDLFVGAAARPNEITYSEDWLRPDYVPPPPADVPPLAGTSPPADVPQSPPADNIAPPLPAEAPSPDPSGGLASMMAPPTGEN
jgi:phospholipid/cholesterol/gamma-HCH transport system substrate-binding protein